MRYIMCGSKGVPAKEKPAGMNDIVGIGDYMTKERAFMRLTPPPDRRAQMLRYGYTHLALYQSDANDYTSPDPLVKAQELGSM